MSERARDVLALAAWTAFLAAVLIGLHALGDGPLAAPPWPGVARWLDARDAPTVVFALVRLVLLGAGWYLLVATVLAAALRLVRADTAARAVESCSPTPVRRLVRAAAGVSVAASLVAVSAAGASEGDESVTMRRLPDAAVHHPGDETDATVAMTRLPDVDATAPPEVPASRHTVLAGEHLWSIAEDALGAAWRRRPTDAEIDPYWRQLIETNRHRLPNPSDPDLLVPSLEIELPPRPPEPVR